MYKYLYCDQEFLKIRLGFVLNEPISVEFVAVKVLLALVEEVLPKSRNTSIKEQLTWHPISQHTAKEYRTLILLFLIVCM